MALFLPDRTIACCGIPWRDVSLFNSDIRCTSRSILGPLLFLLYTAVTAVAGRHGVSVHSYADDTQLYTSCCAVNGPVSVAQLSRCIDDISRWMASNRLKLNVDKTQFIWLGSPRQLETVSQVQLVVGGEAVTASDTVRNLDVTLDDQLSTMEEARR